ncbi:MAG: DPP IV N-terminal domain-containing protein [Acidobacteriota bacterium]|nr:DPP IV N-terminal domain-containing protein [Acidobacteriota bacterium]
MKILRNGLVIFFMLALGAGAAGTDKLTFQQAMVDYGRGLLTPLPRVMGWLDSSHYLESRGMEILSVNARSGESQVFFSPADHPELAGHELSLMDARDWTADYALACFLKQGKLFVYHLRSKRMTTVEAGGSIDTPMLSPDGSAVAFTRANDLYVHDLDTAKTRRLTTDGSDVILNGYASWVYYEEILGRRSRYRAFWWGPDGRRIAFLRFDQSNVPVFPITRSDGVYPELEQQYYPKPGAPNPQVRLGVADLDSKDIHWIPVPDDEEHYLAHPRWSRDGRTLYFQWMNRGQDRLKVFCWREPQTAAREVFSQQRSSWVEFLEERDLIIMDSGELVIRCAIDDWHHIYHVSSRGRLRRLTRGDWAVHALLHLDTGRREVLFSASQRDSTQSHAYRVGLKGGKTHCLTPETGWHSLTPSPDGGLFLDRHSAMDRPDRLVLRDRRGRLLRTLGDSASPQVARYGLNRMQLIRVPAGEGWQLPVQLILPPDFSEHKKYPLVLNVYGGPGAMSVRNAFPGNRGLGAFYLAQMGIVVAIADHRGAGHHGKAGMDLMHRRLGHWELHDYAAVVDFLKQKSWVDGDRVGISGGSYGGYVTALALARSPGVFHFGVASFSVTDWKLYDSVYTERYMDTPQENPQGYKAGSVLEYVDTYRGGLRLLHGTLDDNVHLQNSLQLLDRIQDAGKPVEFMAFPGERHGFRGPKRQFDSRCTLDFWSRVFFNRPWTEDK